ncbi:MAG TPA: flavin reductase family protein [Burkholderiales bacterium]|nr:flavin reductase family protein [Burkholderiales bacterium]
MHKVIDPAILYFGTPVVLVSTLNEDGSPNLAPMSSAWWLRYSCMLGFDASSKTPANLLRTGECVLNLASADMVDKVDRLALLTGTNPPPPHKNRWGYRYEPDKFGTAGLTPIASERVAPPRVLECPVQLEAVLDDARPFGEKDPTYAGLNAPLAIEVRVIRVHVDERLIAAGYPNRIDPTKWQPLIMNFRQFFGLGNILHPSRLSEFPEEAFKPRERLKTGTTGTA